MRAEEHTYRMRRAISGLVTRLRKRNGLHQRELAAILELNTHRIHVIEHRQGRISFPKLMRMIDLLGATPEEAAHLVACNLWEVVGLLPEASQAAFNRAVDLVGDFLVAARDFHPMKNSTPAALQSEPERKYEQTVTDQHTRRPRRVQASC